MMTKHSFMILLAWMAVPAFGKRLFARPEAKEALTVEVRGRLVTLAGAAICSTGCSSDGNRAAEGNLTTLAEACRLHTSCVQSSKDDQVRALFPNLDEDWCDATVEEIGTQVCYEDVDSDKGGLALAKLAGVVRIISDGAEQESWQVCDSLGVSSCEACLGADHRGGVDDYWVTSHACAWHEGRCVAAHFGEPVVTDRRSCKEGGIPADLELVGDDEGSKSHDGAATSLAELERPRLVSLPEGRRSGKVAFLAAYRYPKRGKEKLDGTIPDIKKLFAHLTTKRGFLPGDITVVLDDKKKYPPSDFPGANFLPHTTGAMQFIRYLQDCIDTLQQGDFFFFHYSGHGHYVRDHSGDELDGLDETIYMPNGEHLIDDDFYSELAKIPRGVTATVFADACHSEGFSDLPFNYMLETRTWCTDWTGYRMKSFPEATITYISGSQNHQTSGDIGTGGAMSVYVMKNWKKKQPFYEAMQKTYDEFERLERTQRPNVAAFPSFRDTEDFSPFDPANAAEGSGLLTRDLAFGGPAPTRATSVVMPHICEHGGVGTTGVKHLRDHSRVEAAKNQMKISEELSDATTRGRDIPAEGWEAVPLA